MSEGLGESLAEFTGLEFAAGLGIRILDLVHGHVAVLAFLGMAGFAFSAWRNGQTNAALLTLFLTLAGLWQIVPIVTNNQPRPLKTGEVPEWLMP